MPDFVVSTAFKSQDHITKAFGRMAKGADKFGNHADRAFRKASRSGSVFGGVVKGVLTAGAIQRGIGMLEQGLGGVARGFVEFDGAAIGATARFKDIGPMAKDFDTRLQAIKQSARQAGAVTEYTAAQSAQALDFLARAGFKSQEAMGGLYSMINLATATGEDFAQVADYSSDLLGAFGLDVADTSKKIANLNRLNDVLTKTANSANVTVESMFETMKTAGPISQMLGMRLETVAALTGVLGNSGIKGTEGATVLKNALLNLATMKDPVRKALTSIGVAVDDGAGKFRPATDILSDMGVALKGLTQIQQATVLDTIFGKRAVAGSKNLIDKIVGVKDLESSLLSATGTAEATAERLRKSWGNRLLTLGSAATEAGFKILDAFSKDGKRGIDVITEAVRALDVKPIISGIKTTVAVVRTLYNVIRPFVPLMPVIIGGMLAYSAAIKISAFISFVKVLRSAAIAQGILNVVMTANPIGLIVAGVTALVAVGVMLYTHWDKVVGVFKRLWKVFDNPIIQGLSLIFAPFLAIPALIIKHWGPIKDLFSGLIDKISGFAEKFGILRLFGLGSEEEVDKTGGRLSQEVPPNRAEVESRQRINFDGRINIAGAPDGSTASARTTGAPQIRMELLGANP